MLSGVAHRCGPHPSFRKGFITMSTLPPPPGAPQAQPPAPFGQPAGQFPQGAPQQFGQGAPQQFGYAPQQQRHGGGIGQLFSLDFGPSPAGAKARSRYLWVLIAVAAAVVHSLVTGIQIAVNYFQLGSYTSGGTNTVWGIYALFATLIGVVLIPLGVLAVARTLFEGSVERSQQR